jgi:hypothetical protein
MRTVFTSLSMVAFASVALLSAGCEEESVEAPEFEGEGQEVAEIAAYPEGPFGITPKFTCNSQSCTPNDTGKGSIIENFKFYGFPKGSQDNSSAFPIQLADFYNPTGDGVFPEGSLYGAGRAKPKRLVVVVASVWCPPCNAEARDTLPGLHEDVSGNGVEFLTRLADSATPGDPATFSNLINWTNKYTVDWPATLDPTYKLNALFEAQAYPANMVIDTTTMEILHSMAGAPQEGVNHPPSDLFFDLIENVE